MSRSRMSLEKAARMVLHGDSGEDDGDEVGQRGVRPVKITLPRLNFLERPLPEWWNDPVFTAPLPKRVKR